MNVRTAARGDLPGILEIYNEAVLTTTATYDYQPQTLDQRLAWWEDHERHNYPVFVAEDGGGKILGWSSLNRFHGRPGYRFTTENSIYVASSARGRGIGKSLMPPLIAGAQTRGWHVILAGIDAENMASLRLHGAFGFEKVAHLRQVGFKFDRWLDVVYMERIL